MKRHFAAETMQRFSAFAHDGELAVLDMATGRVHIGADIADLFNEPGSIFIDQGIRLPDAEPIARTWRDMQQKLLWQLRDQLDRIYRTREPVPARVEVVFPDHPTTPDAELERLQHFRRMVLYPPPVDTVGDLSLPAEDPRRHLRQQARALREGCTVGDLSVVTDQREALDHARAVAGDDTLTVGTLYHGPNRALSESEHLRLAKYRTDRERAGARFLVEHPSVLDAERDRVHEETQRFVSELETTPVFQRAMKTRLP